MKNDLVIGDLKDAMNVWVVSANEDLTEGKGKERILCVCKVYSTAVRIADRKGVQGGPANITKRRAYKIKGIWYAPSKLIEPTLEDINKEKIIGRKNQIIKKALELGLTDEEIKVLKG